MKYFAFLLLAILGSAAANVDEKSASWHAATASDLKEWIPARAPVEREHIETELRTASGIKDPKGKYVAGVVLITAGYAAEGKYSNFFLTQANIKVGDISLRPGEYVFGWRRKDDDSCDLPPVWRSQRTDVRGFGRLRTKVTCPRNVFGLYILEGWMFHGQGLRIARTLCHCRWTETRTAIGRR